ncbi:MAG: transposase [Bacteroidia bacterium]|nr:transposase [Bacteroidia bacterium]
MYGQGLRFSEYDYRLTIPGFGPDVSSNVLAEIGNPFRFNLKSQVLKMAGMDVPHTVVMVNCQSSGQR